MGYDFFLIVLLLFSLNGLSQVSTPVKTYNAFEVFQLGHTIDKFDSIACAEERVNTIYHKIDSTKQCQVFRFLKERNDIITIGDIRFENFILHIDTITRKIKGITLMNMYLITDSVHPLIRFLDEYKRIIKFLNSYFGFRSTNETTKHDHNEYYSANIYTWTKKKIKYILTTTEFVKRSEKQILSYSISIDYFKKH